MCDAKSLVTRQRNNPAHVFLKKEGNAYSYYPADSDLSSPNGNSSMQLSLQRLDEENQNKLRLKEDTLETRLAGSDDDNLESLGRKVTQLSLNGNPPDVQKSAILHE